jgi:hypothetical protein
MLVTTRNELMGIIPYGCLLYVRIMEGCNGVPSEATL